LESGPVDLLVADGDGIGTSDGVAAIAAMRDVRPGLRVIMLSGQPQALQLGEASATIDVLRKPLLPVALRAAVAKAMTGTTCP
jgi:DNA-binding NtrC family response regulator